MTSNNLQDALRDALHQRTSLVHPTYRHLERRLVLGGLTLWQWGAVLGALAAAWLISLLLPVPSPWNLSLAVMASGLPTAATLVLSSEGEIDLLASARGVAHWLRRRGVYLPDRPTQPARGYVVAAAHRSEAPPVATAPPNFAIPDLWA